MTREPIHRPWPYIAKSARDEAAEEVAAALLEVIALNESDTEFRNFTRIVYHLSNALRLLESVGASTRPKTQ